MTTMASDFEEIDEALNALSLQMKASVLRSINRKALKKEIYSDLKNVAISKRAKAGIKLQSSKTDKTGVLIGVNRDQYWERWLQKGTLQRTTKRGANRGAIMGRETIKPMYKSKQEPIVKFFRENYETLITKTLKSKLKSTQTKITKLGL